ncbi:carbonic anhydrase family protein [Cytophaga aurantiaca]|uniref:carbonic anhydrase family protein n=1 Tax=Cytophaga aurantiaca TaxID=29530 RepID=UPI000368CFBE|nr:carbonic anhydrase family protein [Cytophaga aurantiaca]
MISARTIISFFLLAILLSCKQTDKITSNTSHDSTQTDSSKQHSLGYIMPGLDHGFEQSPININSNDSSSNNTHKITLYFNDKVNKIENLGHTVQLDFQAGSTITYDDTVFTFKQCHFHTPSEHLIDGITFPMEMHIVNVLTTAPKDKPQYLVIGILFKEGKENAFIKDFLNLIPKETDANVKVKAGTIKLSDLFGTIPKELKNHYFNYKGSLTTPPYTEAVRWFIAKHIFEASAEQIKALNALEGNNARHVQALYGRSVVSN